MLKRTPIKKKTSRPTHWKIFSKIIILHSKRSVPDRNAPRQNIDQMYYTYILKNVPLSGYKKQRGKRVAEKEDWFVSMYSYSWHVRCEKKLVYMYGRDGRGSISVFALREPGFSK